MSNIKFAFHVHTCFSKDSASKPKDIIDFCRKEQIGVIAICDHNEINGALLAQKISDGNPLVIIGEEIRTREGEIIGLFLSSKIMPNQPLLTTISQIRSQGGIVCIPHPGESLRREALTRESVLAIIKDVDIVEVFNARTLLKKDDRWALEIAKKYQKGMLIGSDAHSVKSIKNALNKIKNFDDQKTFLDNILCNSLDLEGAVKTSLVDHFLSGVIKIKKSLDKKDRK